MNSDIDQRQVREITNEIDLGFAFQQFCKGELGEYLLACADADRKAATEALIACTHEDIAAGKDQDFRTEILTIDRWQSWMANAIASGVAAQQRLIQIEQSQ